GPARLRICQKTPPQTTSPPPHSSRYHSGFVTPLHAIHVVRTHCSSTLPLWAIHRTPQFSSTAALGVSRNARLKKRPSSRRLPDRTDGGSPLTIASRSAARSAALP